MSMEDLIGAAIANRHDEGFAFLLIRGDLLQLSKQKKYLIEQGFQVGQADVYPALRTEQEYIDALRAFWKDRVAGWWNYRSDFLKYAICTVAELEKEI